ncbi:MAG TPA: hypothetical protein PK492_00935 [Chitinophagaceae bacterium]|nr:hypothetical protein [Chitinophagaceae bacterium]HNC37895.1 hypothetical protein [Chitinophagaceae bacterium]
MKKFLLCLLISIYTTTSFAQHCPFDGSHLIVIKLVDKNGNVIATPKDTIYLVEVGNPIADSCKFNEGLLRLKFGSMNDKLINRHDGAWVSWAEERVKDCSFMQPGHLAVVLGQAGYNCMIPVNNDYRYVKRKFEIRLKRNQEEKILTTVADEDIYSLCTGSGSWTRIKPLELKIE